jgi:ribosomal subunit interface protein
MVVGEQGRAKERSNGSMTTSVPLAWNLVAKNFSAHDQLQKKLSQKIPKLQRLLVHFPMDAVHLRVVMERHPKKDSFTAAVTLEVPSNTLHSEKNADDPISAFDQAVKTIERELAALKAELRHEEKWKPEAKTEGGMAAG